jgi:predicted RNA-binding Zn-ribbon protein involved in translation (DUF1610 family)
MKTIFFDLETSPMLGYAWQTWDARLLSIEQYTKLLSFAYKVNDKPTKVLSIRTHTERQMVCELWKLFDEADVLIAQNGDKFDVRLANRLFLKHGLKPPQPYKTVDTLKLAKKYFRFDSNKLDYLAEFLLGERKISTDFDLWAACMKKDEKALRKMERYCKKDVDLLVRIYEKLKPWHTGHPNSNLYNETTHRCPVCGGKTQKRGFMVTRVGKYQRYQCTECGAWSKGERIKHDKVIS